MIEKNKYKRHHQRDDMPFVRINGRMLSMNAIVRDWITPYQFVHVDVDENGNLVITPTNDSRGYKTILCAGQMRISASGIIRTVPNIGNERIRCEKLPDNRILCNIACESKESSKFYFTYGTDGQPFYGGWTEVVAPNMDIAVAVFRMYHPDKIEGIVNCSTIYTEEEFKKIRMAGPDGNFHRFCQEIITVTRKVHN